MLYEKSWKKVGKKLKICLKILKNMKKNVEKVIIYYVKFKKTAYQDKQGNKKLESDRQEEEEQQTNVKDRAQSLRSKIGCRLKGHILLFLIV